MSTPIETIDHVALGQSRVAVQYQAAPNFLAYLAALLTPSNELEGVLQQVAQQVDIDVAEGVNLDTLGALVGASRVLPGGAGNPLSAGQSVLDDTQYRMLLRAKIVKNHSHGTNEDIIKGLAYLFGASYVAVDDNNDMSINIGVGLMLSTVQVTLLNLVDILARPGGVQINRRAMFNTNNYFGFAGQQYALGFGEEGQPTVGGIFAEEF